METLQTRVGRFWTKGGRPRPTPRPPGPEAVAQGAPAPRTFSPQDAIRLGYRLFLGRDVEECYVDALAELYPTPDHQRCYFVNLEEFRTQNIPLRTPPIVGGEPPMQIDELRSDDELRTLFAHIGETWRRFGETEPHWSVSTSKRYLREYIDENRGAFYESGKFDALRLFGSLARNGIDASRLKTCLELGCGVGRVTGWLAQRFEHVVGYDISEPHLEVARAHFDAQGIGNVSLRQLSGPDDLREFPRVDAVFSVVVLQHNPPPIIAAMVEALLRALNPGGVAFFQVPTYRVGYRFDLASYLANDANSHDVMEMHVLSQRSLFEIIEREGARAIEVFEDGYTLCRSGEVSSTVLIQKR
jgi:SAM-dependent methyltransferase